MSDAQRPTAPALPPDEAAGLPEETSLHLRKLAHDLSNALEIVVQTSYLLSTVELQEPATEWLHMLEGGVNKALQINSDLRAYIRTQTTR